MCGRGGKSERVREREKARDREREEAEEGKINGRRKRNR